MATVEQPEISHLTARVPEVTPNPDTAQEPVSRFGVPDESRLPSHVAGIYAKFRRQYGFVPNWLSALATNPDTAYRLVVFYEHLFDPHRSHLTAAERELIAVVTSAANECSYCVRVQSHPGARHGAWRHRARAAHRARVPSCQACAERNGDRRHSRAPDASAECGQRGRSSTSRPTRLRSGSDRRNTRNIRVLQLREPPDDRVECRTRRPLLFGPRYRTTLISRIARSCHERRLPSNHKEYQW